MTSAPSQSSALHTPSEHTDNSSFDYLSSAAASSSDASHRSADLPRPSLSSTAFSALFDAEGRLVDEHVFRRCVFEGGIQVDNLTNAAEFYHHSHMFTWHVYEKNSY